MTRLLWNTVGLLILSLGLCLAGCKDTPADDDDDAADDDAADDDSGDDDTGDDDSGDDDDTAAPPRQYNASTLEGGTIVISVDEPNGTISAEDIGGTETIDGTFGPSNDLPGAWDVTIDSDHYLALERPGEMVSAIMPSGGMGAAAVIGVNRDDTSTTGANVEGEYLYLYLGPTPTQRAWGTLDIDAQGGGSWTVKDPGGNVTDSGAISWLVDPDDASLLLVDNGMAESSGMVLPQKMLVTDAVSGMSVAIRDTDTELGFADIAGDYLFVSTEGYGTFDIDSNGDASWTHTTISTGDVMSGQSDGRRTTAGDPIHANNTFVFEDIGEQVPDTYMMAVPGAALVGAQYWQDIFELQYIFAMSVP